MSLNIAVIRVEQRFETPAHFALVFCTVEKHLIWVCVGIYVVSHLDHLRSASSTMLQFVLLASHCIYTHKSFHLSANSFAHTTTYTSYWQFLPCPLLRCVQEYKLAEDGHSCLLQSDNCEGPKCPKQDVHFNDTLFGEMLHGYNNKTQQINLGQIFQMTFR